MNYKTYGLGRVVVLVLGLWAGQALAECTAQPQAPSTEHIATAQANVRDRGFLWRVSKGGHSSYVYGTAHVAAWDWAFPGPVLGQAWHEADVLALEINPLEPETASTLEQKMSAKTAPPLPAALNARMQAVADRLCIAREALVRYRPEMQLATLASMVARDQGLEPTYGIDLQMALMANAAQRPIVSLETVDEQLEALRDDKAPLAQRNADVASALRDLESGKTRSMLIKLMQAWANHDLATLENYAAWCACIKTASEKAAMKRLVDDRNPVMAQRLDALHAAGTKVLLAVGALHLAGPTGLPTLLAKQGYTVQRLY
ncbi:TraB/GumN family protein [Rhodoferax aquaticus]|uniref:TraB/GumN family protein n=1 Tax=Rhodoferax aquaticus TaxID=2527691 RepID=UPI00143D1536|nr:TraB/GumN family protein [Rhodoferax aquaticus]